MTELIGPLVSTAYMHSALYAIARPSVRPSVTRVDQSKRVEVRIVQFSPCSSPIPIVFAGWSSRIPDNLVLEYLQSFFAVLISFKGADQESG